PGGPGWKKVVSEAATEDRNLITRDEAWNVPSGILAILIGCVFIYATLFATGYWIYGQINIALPTTLLALAAGFALLKVWKKIRSNVL
ncbi:MAG: Na+:solute symporter, partial [Flavobacteriaceae bacterium]|nr:Na+:solute symporter [Flavobacteriaceae bacterium]